MFKQKLSIEVKGQQDRMYICQCDTSSPLGELYDALCVMRSSVLNLMNEHEKKEQEKKENKEVENAESKGAEPSEDGVEE